MEWIISLITGAIGGNVAGAVFKNLTLGPLGNTIAGVVGGGAGAEILNLVLGSSAGGGSVVGNVASSGRRQRGRHADRRADQERDGEEGLKATTRGGAARPAIATQSPGARMSCCACCFARLASALASTAGFTA